MESGSLPAQRVGIENLDQCREKVVRSKITLSHRNSAQIKWIIKPFPCERTARFVQFPRWRAIDLTNIILKPSSSIFVFTKSTAS